ncbi:SDR family oxidoreductase [Alphaproteobacteria bacterium KMM 3653]|uniref:SDR family oxidoreductase n=1 Tax=Harenicola maris TaxID=2841044 RepID=A0AAP2CNN3_9RHOB|nr:SDR family oxidoreductase [Harenicola maris]
MAPRLKGRRALVTGAAGGLGRAMAARLAEDGASLMLADRDRAGLAQLCESLGAVPILADSTDPAAIQAETSKALQAHGPVDILVNNAGLSGNSLPLEQITAEDAATMLAVHVQGAIHYAQAVLPALDHQSCGRIINISSHFAMVGYGAMSHYVAAKSAMLGLTKAWALELAARKICVNAVAPALLDTPMTRASLGHAEIDRRAATVPLGRLAGVDDIAHAVAWLASDEAAMMTGQTISPNGGWAVVGI